MNIILSDLRSYYTIHEQRGIQDSSILFVCPYILVLCLVLKETPEAPTYRQKLEVAWGCGMIVTQSLLVKVKVISPSQTIKEWPLRGHQSLVSSRSDKKAASWHVLFCFPVLLIMTPLSKEFFSFLFNFTIVVKEILFANTTWD